MKKRRDNQLNIYSNKGFTMQDLMIALVILMSFVGVVGGMLYNIYKLNVQTKMTAEATNYAILILEDIDKIAYEQVENSLASTYASRFSIPSGYQVQLEVTKYNEGNDKADLIKKVKLTVSYELAGQKEDFIVHKLKMKEIAN